ncbi:lysophospholipid acyltransferase family protein [Actibacterium pelagium]|uniref:Phospholipid/glycerol acyltransferase domain-containing protein n=1 Tax=Actibacterium pelagium TaxID=2029103 RepID=A0A917EM26_9RHOB|nr:lysophospholipid acyltransferase family protein [Actibacterium pelagium]GGE60229.1 hypothetical protein GCM10011517_29770 [Actibacterium pelagium]
MQKLVQTWRGSYASIRWLAGAPLMNLRMARATDQAHARKILIDYSSRFLETCRVGVDLSGPTPKAGQGCVVCYNESSFIDLMAFCKEMWDHIDRAAAADLYTWFPFARSAFRRLPIDFVARGNRDATNRTMEGMVDLVRSGERVAWGGEGRLSGQDGVRRFKVGAGLIAMRAEAPIVPVAFFGGHHVMPLASLRARPGQLSIRFGEPIQTAGIPETEARDLADHVQSVVAGLYEAARAERAENHAQVQT